MNFIAQIINNLGCDFLALVIAIARFFSHLGDVTSHVYFGAIVWVGQQTDHAIVMGMLAFLGLSIVGLHRWKDPLYHSNGSCPHVFTCPYFDSAIEPDDEEEDSAPAPDHPAPGVVVLGVATPPADVTSKPVTSPGTPKGVAPKGVAPKVIRTRLFVEKKKMPKADHLWTGAGLLVGGFGLAFFLVGVCQALVALTIITTVAGALYGSWGVYRLGVDRKMCRCRHRAGCHLDPANCEPAPGTEDGAFEIRGNRPGFLDPNGNWVPSGTRNRGRWN